MILVQSGTQFLSYLVPRDTAGSISVVPSCSSLLIISQRSSELHIYAPLEMFSSSYSEVPLNCRVWSLFLMSSQQDQAAVQAASDMYVAAHQGALFSEIDVIHQCGHQLYLYSFPWYVQCLCAILANIPAATALLTYDSLLKLSEELSYIWKKKWKFGTTLYYLVRYGMILFNFVQTISFVLGLASLQVCFFHDIH